MPALAPRGPSAPSRRRGHLFLSVNDEGFARQGYSYTPKTRAFDKWIPVNRFLTSLKDPSGLVAEEIPA